MLDLLSDYLKQATSPELKDQFQVVCDALDKVGLDGYEDAIEEIIYAEDALDAGDVIFQLTNLIRAQACLVLREHAIVFDEETSLQMLGDIISGVADLPEHEERQQIIELAKADSNIRERFCMLLQMVTKYQPEVLLQHLVSVSPSFMAKLVDLDEIEEEDEEVIVARKERLDRFHHFSSFLPDGMPSHIGAMLNNGADVGMSYSVYADYIGSKFEQMLPQQVAEEMFGMAIVSRDGFGNPLQMLKDHMEEYISDAQKIAEIMTCATKINIDFKP